MNLIELEAVPNQSFVVYMEGSRYELIVKETNLNAMAVTIFRNGSILLNGMRCVTGTPLIPYEYMEDGNFAFITENGEFPNWEKFGRTQFLVYLTRAEVEALREPAA